MRIWTMAWTLEIELVSAGVWVTVAAAGRVGAYEQKIW